MHAHISICKQTSFDRQVALDSLWLDMRRIEAELREDGDLLEKRLPEIERIVKENEKKFKKTREKWEAEVKRQKNAMSALNGKIVSKI